MLLKNAIAFIVILLLCPCCKESEIKKTSGSDNSDNKDTEKSVLVKETPLIKSVKKNSEKISIPKLGEFTLSKMNLDSLNEYGAGDCWGTVFQFSSGNLVVGIDSFFCGDYGFNFKHFQINLNGSIEVVRELKWENTPLDSANYQFVLTESVFDFLAKPPVAYTKLDTILEHFYKNNIFPKEVNKSFSQSILEFPDSVYNHLLVEYGGSWEMEMEN